jgi:hypothetical protein
MGWQSYVIGFNTPEQREKILVKCRLHNETLGDEPRGEELICFGEADFKPGKQYKRGCLSGCEKVILFGNGGGRHGTFMFFAQQDLIEPDTDRFGWTVAMEKRLTKPVPFELNAPQDDALARKDELLKKLTKENEDADKEMIRLALEQIKIIKFLKKENEKLKKDVDLRNCVLEGVKGDQEALFELFGKDDCGYPIVWSLDSAMIVVENMVEKLTKGQQEFH